MQILVDDLSREELEVFTELNEVQLARFYEPRTGLFIAESDKVAIRALEAGYKPHSFLIEDKKIERARPLFEPYPDVPVYIAEHDAITTITGYNLTGGILVAMYRREMPGPAALLSALAGEDRPLRIAVLEGLVNPANVGAIIRNAAALSMDAVLVTRDCADPLYRRAIRVGMGCVFQVPWDYIPVLAEGGIGILKQFGFHTAAMALSGDSIPIDDPVLKSYDRLALVFGAEGDGLKPSTIASCDHIVKIPMHAGVDSLNVAAASAVAFWELC